MSAMSNECTEWEEILEPLTNGELRELSGRIFSGYRRSWAQWGYLHTTTKAAQITYDGVMAVREGRTLAA